MSRLAGGKRERAYLSATALLAVCSWVALLPGPGLVRAAGLPGAFTGYASQLTTSSAVLKGSVHPAGEQTSYSFQYGRSSAYEAQTTPASAGSGSQSLQVTTALGGLLAGVTYHFRLVAANASGTVYGQDRSFTTKSVPLAFSLTRVRDRDVFGSPVSITGALSGTASAHRALALQANPFPYLAGFKAYGVPQVTDASGGFAFFVTGLRENTQLRVATLDTPPTHSATVQILVAVRVSLHLRAGPRRGFARLYGTVAPAEPGATVVFQLLLPGHRWVRVGGTLARRGPSGRSSFAGVVRVRGGGLYRALVEPVSGAQVANHSRGLRIR